MEDDICGICQSSFETCCPKCKIPGDSCPPSMFSADFHEYSYWTLQTQLPSALYRDVAGEGSSLPFVSCRLDSNLVFSL